MERENCKECTNMFCQYYGNSGNKAKLKCFRPSTENQENKIKKTVKRHATAILKGYEVPFNTLQNDKKVYNALLSCASQCGFNVLQAVKHEFYPHGMTAVLVLGESHISIHTYPEDNEAWIDCFTCGEKNQPTRYLSAVASLLKCKILDYKCITR